eukprot:scaffold1978_cov381-Prasinococcus_capsulatus_cf.AAC.5
MDGIDSKRSCLEREMMQPRSAARADWRTLGGPIVPRDGAGPSPACVRKGRAAHLRRTTTPRALACVVALAVGGSPARGDCVATQPLAVSSCSIEDILG